MADRLIIDNVTRGTRLAEAARVADNLPRRVIGLLLDKELAHGHGLWIVPCNSIHSFGMRFVFDAVFLDKDLRVVHLMHEMKPWRTSKIVFAAHGVLELPAGVIAATATQLGDQLEMKR